MIEGFEIITATMVTNISKTGYKDVTAAACKSWATAPYVDKVLVVDGRSIDDTVQVLRDAVGPKFNLGISPEKWDLDSWSWEDVQYAENELISTVRGYDNPNKILMWYSSDNIFTENYIDECELAIRSLIDSDFDFIHYTFQKAVTTNFLSNPYHVMKGWWPGTIMKFQPNITWGDIAYSEAGIDTSRPIVQGQFPFRTFPVCYDMFKFTRENIAHKISRHPGFHAGIERLPNVDEYIVEKFIRKLKEGIGVYPCNMDMHPKIARETFLFTLNDTHFGTNLFDNLREFFVS